MPADVVAVAESGIRDAEDVHRLADAGYQAVLVGETLCARPDRAGGRGRSGRSRPMSPVPTGDTDTVFVKICGITSEADALVGRRPRRRRGGFRLRPLARGRWLRARSPTS